jgi:hypothetical protein
MAQPATGVAVAFGLGTAITIAIAWPVVTHPSQLIFGNEIVGRHYDAYTVMEQLASGASAGPYTQPLTDRAGALFAHVMNPVAAYNLLVLLTFPLSAAATYALARYLVASHAAALGTEPFSSSLPISRRMRGLSKAMPRLKGILVGLLVGVLAAVLWIAASFYATLSSVTSQSGSLGAASVDPVAVVVVGLCGFAFGYWLTLRRSRNRQRA